MEAGETDEMTARREIAEEAGLTELEYIDDLGEFTRARASAGETQYEEKTIHMFLFAAKPHATLKPTMEITDARWIPYREAVELLGSPHHDWFAKDRIWFASVFERVREAIQRD
jgi:8-oxo-dGTP pyrophosphatase MutT (NUDIX family)